ncbi:MAG: LysR substrate-binding domain-containing protein [Burkholderiaceae bacterium]
MPPSPDPRPCPQPAARNALTPEALAMVDTIARSGSFAAAARELGKVPSALTYSVRQLEEALDVLLFDRRSRQAEMTAAGKELLAEGRRLLAETDAVANRVKRVATGWETGLTVVVDDVISRATLLDLCERFYALDQEIVTAAGKRAGPPTRLRLRTEVLSGTLEALATGQADLAIGVGAEAGFARGLQRKDLGALEFVFAVAPQHPLALAEAPISDAELMRHRAVAVADSAQRAAPLTVNLLPGQDVLTVASMHDKIEALRRGLGCGFVPEALVRAHVAAGRLVVKAVQRPALSARLVYVWRMPAGAVGRATRAAQLGLALRWWLAQLEHSTTRRALLEGVPARVLASAG